MAKSKFFRVAVEGATTDGRALDRLLLQDIANSYNPSVYGARVFAEHIRGITPDSPFQAYGDVTAVKAENIADGPLKGKLALYAQIDPTSAMVNLVKTRQKIYTSIEITPKFAGTERAYLSGLGITDSPASLGTEILTFAAQNPSANPFAARKQAPGNLFSAAEEVVIELEDDVSDTSVKALFTDIRDKLAKLTSKAKVTDSEFAEMRDTFTSLIDALSEFAERDTAVMRKFANQADAIGSRLDAIEANANKQATALAAFRNEIDKTPASPSRPAATGRSGIQQTDC